MNGAVNYILNTVWA